MWSLGVVSYALMSRTLPFDADSTEGIQRNILCEPFGYGCSCCKRAVIYSAEVTEDKPHTADASETFELRPLPPTVRPIHSVSVLLTPSC